MTEIKRSYKAGAAVAKAVNPVGDNVAANFVRGATLYFDPDVAAKRNVGIERDKAAFKDYLLQKS